MFSCHHMNFEQNKPQLELQIQPFTLTHGAELENRHFTGTRSLQSVAFEYLTINEPTFSGIVKIMSGSYVIASFLYQMSNDCIHN